MVNYRVEVKATSTTPWRDTGIIESNRETANKVWSDIIRRIRYHSFRLQPVSYGTPIKRVP